MIGAILKKKRLAKSFPKKTPEPRSIEQVNREYHEHALLAGHKTRLMQELSESAEALQKEIDEHLYVMRKANSEVKELQKKVSQAEASKLEPKEPLSEPHPTAAPTSQVSSSAFPSEARA